MFNKKNLPHIITIAAFVVLIVLGLACASAPPKEAPTESKVKLLDQAIREAARNIESSVKENQKIALLNFDSASEQFSEYVLEELSGQLVQGKKLTVVDRRELELIQKEENFQLSGEVSDESARAMGKKLGAQLIVSGSLQPIGNLYRLRIRVLNVESAAIEASPSADIDAKEEKVEFLLGIKGQTKINIETSQSSGQTAVYKIGDMGPAGGIIFYDKGEFTDSWRYLESAPASTEFFTYWGDSILISYIETKIGSGKRNTALLVSVNEKFRRGFRAAQRCANLNFGGFTDWFLPSRDELDLMYKNLKQKGLGGFSSGDFAGWYWSSSQGNGGTAWGQFFDSGFNQPIDREEGLSVRAIRAF